jgi:hypothetical protein
MARAAQDHPEDRRRALTRARQILRESFQFAVSHLMVSLFSFNVGIELGQLAVLAVMLPALSVLLRFVLVGRVGTIVLSALVAHVGWHWMMERGSALWKVEWPSLDAAGLAILARWVAGVLLAAGVVSVLVRRMSRVTRTRPRAAA